MTRWQKFALEKGITKRKRERMVFDEQAKEWRPRYGYKVSINVEEWFARLQFVEWTQRANDEGASWAIPVKDGEDPTSDPFQNLAVEKKKRIVKNKLSMLRNMVRSLVCFS